MVNIIVVLIISTIGSICCMAHSSLAWSNENEIRDKYNDLCSKLVEQSLGEYRNHPIKGGNYFHLFKK